MKKYRLAHWGLLKDEFVTSIKKYWMLYITFIVGFTFLILSVIPIGEPYVVDAKVLRYGGAPSADGGDINIIAQFENGRTIEIYHDQSFSKGEAIEIRVLPRFLVPDRYQIAY